VSVVRGAPQPNPTHPDLMDPAHAKWAAEVLRLANGRCAGRWHKGNRYGHKLVADHIKERQDMPDLRLVVSNGQGLCYSCHALKTNEERRKRFLAG
jgi:5-methylcytosine-specific restriction endonuclease McrA